MEVIHQQKQLVSSDRLLAVYRDTRAHSVSLCAPLNPEDYIPQPAEFASPPKWHLAHTTWFFEEMILKKYLAGYKEFDPVFNFLFNSYYQSVGKRAVRAERGANTRPTVKQVHAYRRHVDAHMEQLLSGEFDPAVEELVTLGVNHEQQHQELLITDLKHTFSLNPIWPVYREDFDLAATQNKSDQWLAVSEGVYEVGHEGNGFCFDNELGRHKVFLHDFEIADHLVTNGEFIAFIEAGGYTDFRFWLDEGWSWVQEHGIDAPLYWIKENDRWHRYTLAGLKPVQPENILAHISFYEAQAFASWKGMRLPTEFEWEVASKTFNWGARWEWTYSAYLPYPGFRIAEGAVGEYNGKFMMNQMVLRGASVATAKGHSRNTYRNFFHAQHRWQYTGIRLVR